MQDFILWDRDEIVEAIKTIEMAEMSGATQVTYGGAGGVMLRDVGSMYRTKRRLYARLEQIDGRSYGAGTRPRSVNVVIDNGHRRPFGFRGRL